MQNNEPKRKRGRPKGTGWAATGKTKYELGSVCLRCDRTRGLNKGGKRAGLPETWTAGYCEQCYKLLNKRRPSMLGKKACDKCGKFSYYSTCKKCTERKVQ